MKLEADYTLYLVTDRAMGGEKFLEIIAAAVRGGASLVQLREKTADSGEFYARALAAKRVTDAAGVPFLINDRVDIALAVNAAGVHVGQSDLPARVVRKILGPEKILGVSAHNVAEALRAEADGADYLGVGTVFPTGTKKDAEAVSVEMLASICRAVKIPVVAIGGITVGNLPQLSGTGIAGAAVVSALMAAENPERAAKAMCEILRRETVNGGE